MTQEFKPFDNDTQSITIGNGNGLTFENSKDKITIYGDTEISLNDTENLKQLVSLFTSILEKQDSLNENKKFNFPTKNNF